MSERERKKERKKATKRKEQDQRRKGVKPIQRRKDFLFIIRKNITKFYLKEHKKEN